MHTARSNLATQLRGTTCTFELGHGADSITIPRKTISTRKKDTTEKQRAKTRRRELSTAKTSINRHEPRLGA